MEWGDLWRDTYFGSTVLVVDLDLDESDGCGIEPLRSTVLYCSCGK